MVDSVLIESGDADDAENVDAMFGHPALADYVHPDEQFTITATDPANGTIDVSAGKAYVGVTSLQTSAGDERRQLMVAVEKDAEAGVDLATVDGTNYLFLDAQLGVGDSPQWVVENAENPPSDESFLVARVHAVDLDGNGTAGRIDVLEPYPNRGPALVADRLKDPSGSGIDLASAVLENATHDDVRVPASAKDIVIEDFNSGALSDLWQNDTDFVEVQSDVAVEGSALKVTTAAGGGTHDIKATEGLPAYPQPGDVISFRTRIEATALNLYVAFGDYGFRVRSASDRFELFENVSLSQIDSKDFDFSNYLGEWFEWDIKVNEDGGIKAVVSTEEGSEVATLTADPSDGTGNFTSEVQIFFQTPDSSETGYVDEIVTTRRLERYVRATERGRTDLGNEVAPAGAIHALPLEATEDEPKQIIADVPVSSDLAAGDEGSYVLQVGGDPVMRVYGEADGNGGVQNLRPHLEGNAIRNPSNSTTADSMTGDPESAAEDGYIEIDIDGTSYQVPIYAA